MAADHPPDRPEQDGGALSKEAAAEVGAMVAEQVRQAIQSAERSAEELRRQALGRASEGRESVNRMASLVINRIDDVEAKIGELLQTLRDEVARTVDEVDRTELANDVQPEPKPGWRVAPEAPASPPVPLTSSEVSAPATNPASAPAAARRVGRRRFGRRVLSECAVCGRAPRADEALEAWHRTGKLGLCPQCQHDGWQLPAGARVPSRPARRVES